MNERPPLPPIITKQLGLITGIIINDVCVEKRDQENEEKTA